MTPTELREAVARALRDDYCAPGRPATPWEELHPAAADEWLHQAGVALRVVREAMREPSEEMIEAAKEGYRRKYADVTAGSPTEHPDDGGGTFGYALRYAIAASPLAEPRE